VSDPRLEIANLTVEYAGGAAPVVDGFELVVAPGTRCGLVGESGSGKSSIVRSILGLIRPPHQARVDRILIEGVGDVSRMTPRRLREIRGGAIGYVGQNPFGALHPVVTIARQFEGFLRDHGSWHGEASEREIERLLMRLGISDPPRILRGHAGELSGGMAQRVVIAMASLLGPPLLIADEPTTALDVTVQRQVLDLIAQPRTQSDQSLLLVTHDLSVVAQYCDEVVVLRQGVVVERGPVASVFTSPEHPYTESLIGSVPGITAPPARLRAHHEPAAPAPKSPRTPRRRRLAPAPAPGDDSPVLALDGVHKTYRRGHTSVAAVCDVSLRIERGETVALVGESGSGKSTLGRLAVMLERPDSGRVGLEGTDLTGMSHRRLRSLRSRMQIVFQEPFQSLDPQLKAAQSVAEPLGNLDPRLGRAEVARRVAEAFELAGLDPGKAQRYPHQLSGGEQQRVGIARAIATRPSLVVLDEPTSSLDLTVRAAIVEQLQTLQRELGMSYLFISHDLATARQIADRVAVMYRGRIVESGPAWQVLAEPRHPYTQALSEACLDPDPRVTAEPTRDRKVLADDVPGGCPYLPRCERATEECRRNPALQSRGEDDRVVACLHPLERPAAASVGAPVGGRGAG
jgi:peptide/nickel transport system ATP-binding protein